MKQIVAFFIFPLLIYSCKKQTTAAPEQTVTGTLRYSSPASDGIGLYYVTDQQESLLFKNEFSDYNSQYLHYKPYVDLHTRLTFRDNGETGCSLGMLPCSLQHPLRLVEVVWLEKQ
jgi:hypothetical protein